jgi:hypothetical protein
MVSLIIIGHFVMAGTFLGVYLTWKASGKGTQFRDVFRKHSRPDDFA